MALIERNNVIEGTFHTLSNAGAPTSGTTAVQTLNFAGTITGGTFALTFGGATTGPIAWSATNATLVANIQAALNALGTLGNAATVVGAGSLVAGIGGATVTFSGVNFAVSSVGLISAPPALMLLTGAGAALSVANTTPGVTATYRGASAGQLLSDTVNNILYENKGVPQAPVWAKVGLDT